MPRMAPRAATATINAPTLRRWRTPSRRPGCMRVVSCGSIDPESTRARTAADHPNVLVLACAMGTPGGDLHPESGTSRRSGSAPARHHPSPGTPAVDVDPRIAPSASSVTTRQPEPGPQVHAAALRGRGDAPQPGTTDAAEQLKRPPPAEITRQSSHADGGTTSVRLSTITGTSGTARSNHDAQR